MSNFLGSLQQPTLSHADVPLRYIGTRCEWPKVWQPAEALCLPLPASRQSSQKKQGFFLRGLLLEPQNVGFERLFEILAQKLPISSAWICTG